MAKIPSRPYLQLELPLIMPNDEMPNEQMENAEVNDRLNPDRHLQEDLMDATLPNDWRLHETSKGDWYARHPEAGQTPDRDTPEAAAEEAHDLHQDWIENRATHDNPEGTMENNADNDAAPDAPQDESPNEEAGSQETPNEEADNEEMTNGKMTNDAPSADVEVPGPTEIQDPDVPEPAPEVYDEEKGRFVEVGTDDREYARALHQWVEMGTIVTGLALKAIRDNEAYTALGCSSFKEYCETMAPMGRKTAYRHISRAETYEQFLPDFDPGSVSNRHSAPLKRLLTGSDADGEAAGGDGEANETPPESPVPTALRGLSNGKLDALGDLGDDRLAGYVESEELRTPDGQVITREEIEEMTAKEVRRRVDEVLEPHKQKAEQEKEKRLKAEAEREALKEKLERKKEEIKRSRDLEETFGPKAARLEEKRRRMEKMEEALREASKQIYKIGLTTEDPIPDQERAMDLLAHAERLADAAREELADVVLNPDLSGNL